MTQYTFVTTDAGYHQFDITVEAESLTEATEKAQRKALETGYTSPVKVIPRDTTAERMAVAYREAMTALGYDPTDDRATLADRTKAMRAALSKVTAQN